MDLLENMLVTLLGAIVGALLTFGLPYMVRLRKNQARSDLVGTWKSAYLIEDSRSWIEEKVEIKMKGSRFQLHAVNNPAGDLYEAVATLSNGELTGSWHSTGGYANGSLLLAVRPQGGLLYGYYTGLRENNERVFAAWVLGQGDDDVKRGKQLLQNQTFVVENG